MAEDPTTAPHKRFCKAAFWKLPHDTRRMLYRTVSPRSAEGLKRRRTQTDPLGYSYRGVDETKALFVHIPKCAGLAVNKQLYGGKGPGHITLRQSSLTYSQSEFKEIYTFTFVRNPFDRLRSAYYFLKSGGINEKDQDFANAVIKDTPSFKHFVMDWASPRRIWSYLHLVPQYHYLRISGAQPRVDFIGKFENLADDYAKVTAHLGIDGQLEVVNKTSSTGYSSSDDDFDEETVEKIRSLYATDCRLFGYHTPGT